MRRQNHERLVEATALADAAEDKYKVACEAERTAILQKDLVIRELSEEATGDPPAWGPAYKELLRLFGEGAEEDRQAASHLLKRLEEKKAMDVDARGPVDGQQRVGDAGATQETAADTGESSGAVASQAQEYVEPRTPGLARQIKWAEGWRNLEHLPPGAEDRTPQRARAPGGPAAAGARTEEGASPPKPSGSSELAQMAQTASSSKPQRSSSGTRPSAWRPRRRASKPSQQQRVLISYNGGGWAPTRELLGVVAGAAQGSYVCGQECRLRTDAADTVVAASRKDGWAIALAEARATHGPGQHADGRHTSAGVAMRVPTHHGITRAGGHNSWDASPPQHPGRFVLAHCNVVGGIIVASVYLLYSRRMVGFELLAHEKPGGDAADVAASVGHRRGLQHGAGRAHSGFLVRCVETYAGGAKAADP